MNIKNIRFAAAALATGLMVSGALPLVAMAAVPITTSISPSSVLMGSSGFTLTVNGNNFEPSSVVNFNGGARSTTYASSTQLTASIPSSDLTTTGTFSVTVTNSNPNGGTSNAQSFTVGNLTPATISISPSSVAAGGGAFTLTVNGANFSSSSTVNFNGSPRLTSFVSSGQLNATINASDISTPGTFNITVQSPTPGGGTSNTQVLTVTGTNPFPALNTISPSFTLAGSGGFTMTLFGSNFNSNSVVRFNGIIRTTTFISPSQVTAVIPASDVAMSGTYALTVQNPMPGGGTSNALIFTVSPVSFVPSLPNTGFGPSAEGLGWNIALAGIIALVMTMGAVRLWFAK